MYKYIQMMSVDEGTEGFHLQVTCLITMYAPKDEEGETLAR